MDGIPDFLIIPQGRRNATWEANPPRTAAPQPVVLTPITAPPQPLRVARMAEGRIRKKIKTEMDLIPKAFRRWDPRKSRFVDEREDDARRLKQAAERLGVTLETEMKLAIVPYLTGGSDLHLPSERGRTSIKADAPQWEIDNRVCKAALRVGKKLHRVEVVSHEGGLLETYMFDSEKKVLDNGARQLSLSLVAAEPQPSAEADQNEEVQVAKKAKKNGKTNGEAKGPGVISTIIETIGRDRGASVDEIIAVLTKRFPDRKVKSMTSTVKIQANRNAKKKDKDEKRGGVVYYG